MAQGVTQQIIPFSLRAYSSGDGAAEGRREKKSIHWIISEHEDKQLKKKEHKGTGTCNGAWPSSLKR